MARPRSRSVHLALIPFEDRIVPAFDLAIDGSRLRWRESDDLEYEKSALFGVPISSTPSALWQRMVASLALAGTSRSSQKISP